MTTTESAPVGTGMAGEACDLEDDSVLAVLDLPGMRLTGCRSEVLRSSRFRPVFRYFVEYEDEGGAVGMQRIVIGKADYRHGGSRTFEYMQRLWEAGTLSGGAPGIPEPIAYLNDRSLLVQSEAPGRCLYEWLVQPGGRSLEPAGLAGRWLGRLHGLVLDGRNGHMASDFEQRKLNQYCTELSGVLPEQATRIDDLTTRSLVALHSLEPGLSVPTHGDYQPKNIYVDGPQVTVIDWDRGALGRPERDVGHFVGQCLTMSYARTGTFGIGTRWNEAFLDGYSQSAPPGWEPGLAPYLARTLIEVLYYKLVVKPVRDASFVPVWLDQIEAALAA